MTVSVCNKRCLTVGFVLFALYSLFFFTLYIRFTDDVWYNSQKYNPSRAISRVDLPSYHDFIGSNRILVYPLVDAVKPKGYVAVSNDTVMVNFDGKGYILAPSHECIKSGFADYIRLPIPVVSRVQNVNHAAHYYRSRSLKPENQCLPAAIHYLVQEAINSPTARPAVVPLHLDTGVFHVDMVNSLLISGYFMIHV